MTERNARAYRERLQAVLRSEDPEQLRAFLVEQAALYGNTAEAEELQGRSKSEMADLMGRMRGAQSEIGLRMHATASSQSTGVRGGAKNQPGRPARNTQGR